jgi:hypothetical protein
MPTHPQINPECPRALPDVIKYQNTNVILEEELRASQLQSSKKNIQIGGGKVNLAHKTSFLEVWYMVDPKYVVEFQVTHAKRTKHARNVFLQLSCDAAIGLHDQEFSATIPPSPPNTMVHYIHTPRTIDETIYLFNSYMRMSGNIFQNLELTKVIICGEQRYVQKNCMSQR